MPKVPANDDKEDVVSEGIVPTTVQTPVPQTPPAAHSPKPKQKTDRPRGFKGFILGSLRSFWFWLDVFLTGLIFTGVYILTQTNSEGRLYRFAEGNTSTIIFLGSVVLAYFIGSWFRSFVLWMTRQRWSLIKQCRSGTKAPIYDGRVIVAYRGPGYFYRQPHETVGNWIDIRLQDIPIPRKTTTDRDLVALSANATAYVQIEDPMTLVLRVAESSAKVTADSRLPVSGQRNNNDSENNPPNPEDFFVRKAEAAVSSVFRRYSYKFILHNQPVVEQDALEILIQDIAGLGINCKRITLGEIVIEDRQVAEQLSMEAVERAKQDAKRVIVESEGELMDGLVENAKKHIKDGSPQLWYEYALQQRDMMTQREVAQISGGQTFMQVGGRNTNSANGMRAQQVLAERSAAPTEPAPTAEPGTKLPTP